MKIKKGFLSWEIPTNGSILGVSDIIANYVKGGWLVPNQNIGSLAHDKIDQIEIVVLNEKGSPCAMFNLTRMERGNSYVVGGVKC